MPKVVAYDTVKVLATAVKSNPIPVSTATTKLSIYVDYTLGKEEGILLTLEYCDDKDLDWAIVGDIGGATAPGLNSIISYTWKLSASGVHKIAIPERHLIQGDYRLSVIRDGAVAPDGTIYAVMKTGEY